MPKRSTQKQPPPPKFVGFNFADGEEAYNLAVTALGGVTVTDFLSECLRQKAKEGNQSGTVKVTEQELARHADLSRGTIFNMRAAGKLDGTFERRSRGRGVMYDLARALERVREVRA